MPLRLRYPQPEPWPFWDELFGMNSGKTGEASGGITYGAYPSRPPHSPSFLIQVRPTGEPVGHLRLAIV
jgi:hypothetical protein